MPTLHIVAGPNGSGKSTLTRSRRFGGAHVIDPDAIARRIAPGDLESATLSAGREAARERRVMLAGRRTLVVETTLAGKSMLRVMEQARAAGYRVELHYVSVNSVAEALDRIASRVVQGGHDVPELDVRRRFARSLANLPAAIACSDIARLYDNASTEEPHREVAILAPGSRWIAENPPGWVDAAVSNTGSSS